MKTRILLLTACVAALITTACAPKLGGSDYNVSEIGDMSRSIPGVVLSKRVIQMHARDPSQPSVGAAAGGSAGALVGSTIGQGKGSVLGMAAGGIAGAIGGHFAEQKLTHQEGFEYQVRLDGSQEIRSISQGAEPNIPVGAPVYIIENIRTDGFSAINEGKKGRSRIIPR